MLVIKVKSSLLVIVAVVLVASTTKAKAATLFFSGDPTDPTAATAPLRINPDLRPLNLGVGDSASLWLWLDPEGDTINGLGHSIVTQPAGALAVDAYVLDNPIVAGLPRWNGTSLGTLNSLVTDANAVAVAGAVGVNPALAGLDPTYDPVSGAFRIGRIDFRLLVNQEVAIFLEVGTMKITSTTSSTVNPVMIHFGFDEPAPAPPEGPALPGNVPGARSIIPDAIVPEPTTLTVLAFGLAALLPNRRRGH